MASLYADTATSQNNALLDSSSYVKEGWKVTGRLCLAHGKYTTTGAETTSDVVFMARLPKNATVIPHLSNFFHDGGLSGTLTVNVGDYDEDETALDADRFISAANVAAASNTLFTEAGTASGVHYTTVGPTWIGVDIVTMATAAASGIFVCNIVYAVST